MVELRNRERISRPARLGDPAGDVGGAPLGNPPAAEGEEAREIQGDPVATEGGARRRGVGELGVKTSILRGYTAALSGPRAEHVRLPGVVRNHLTVVIRTYFNGKRLLPSIAPKVTVWQCSQLKCTCLSANSGLARSFSVLYSAGSRYGESGATPDYHKGRF